MFDRLQALGLGIVGFAIIIGIGAVVLLKFGGAVALCDSPYVYNSTIDKCANISEAEPSVNSTNPYNAGWTNMNYLGGQLGSSGLAGWTPAIIAFSIGMLFLGAFLLGRGKRAY